ncbi:hypothetical protein HU200_005788 [Digitaria exilis]|uniref:Plant bHLH transcription factor ACT-like domain-containing protein n=1 Tax=Digitaria exilis TaxID=1010633 RepID=A0A835KSC8_9POAL|nr:hypothetical protein HU200_005788 [Digitaria exilis]
MDDPSLFMEWAMMETLQQEHLAPASGNDDGCVAGATATTFPSLQALREASQAAEMVEELIGQPPHAAANSWSSSSGDVETTAAGGNNIAGPLLSNSSVGSSNTTMTASWNFGAPPRRDGMPWAGAAARGLPEMMDKATILSDATRYVKELQEKLKELENGSNNDRSIESWVLVKKTCVTVPDEGSSPPSWTSSGTAATSRKPLPEIEVRFLEEKSVVVRIHCEDGKGVAVRVLTEVDELHLNIIHANVMPFLASTLIITITAKASCHFAFI